MPSGTACLRLVLLGAAIGVPAALVAAAFLAFVHELEHWLWNELPGHLGASSPPWYLVIGLPTLGACLVLAADAGRVRPGDRARRPVFPAIFLGVALATLAVIALDVSPTLAVAVGTGAGMAAGTRLLLTPLLFAALLVGRPGLDAIPAAVLATAAAWLTIAALEARQEQPPP